MTFPLPLRRSFALTLIAFGLFLGALVTWSDISSSFQILTESSQRELAGQGSRLSSRIEHYMNVRDIATANWDIALMSSTPHLTKALLIDDAGLILVSSSPELKGVSFSRSGAQADENLLKQSRLTMSATIAQTADGNTIYGFFPLDLSLKAGELRPSSVGVVYLESTLKAQKDIVLGNALRRLAIIGAVLLLFIAFAWLYLDWAVTRRAKELSTLADRMAGGELSARSSLAGSDELAKLGDSFNRMAEKIGGQTQALIESENRFRLLIENGGDGFELWDGSGRFVDANTKTCEMLGYSKEELLSLCVGDIDPEFPTRRYVEEFDKLREHAPMTIISRHRRKDGTLFPVEVTISVMVFEGREYAICLTRDITARVEQEAKLAFTQAAVDGMGDSAFWVLPDGRFVYANDAACRALGYTREELLTMRVADIDSAYAEKVWNHHWEVLKDAGALMFVSAHKRKDGVIIPVEVRANYIKHGDMELNCAVARDISERKLAEEQREKLEAQLLQAQKMESIGHLAGGVAHDFNNMLGVIIGNAELALSSLPEDSAAHESLIEITKAANRSATITRQLLAFARKQTITPKIVDVNEALEQMLKMIRRLIGEDIKLAWTPGFDVWKVRIDPSQLDQILANLATNARDAIAGVGAVSIETDNATIDAGYASVHADAVPGDYVMLAISDTGCGIPKEKQEQIFDPFFTTKEVGRGTGLGLSTVYGIVRQNGGFIHLYSEVGKGSTFRIYLPRVEEQAEKAQKSREVANAPTGSETVLIVEDEKSNLLLGKRMLETLGYKVLTASTPIKALEILGKRDSAVDLVLTDVVMPEMNGRELVETIRAAWPDIKYLYMSGYTSNIIAERGVLEEGASFISKPFSLRELGQKVRDALDGKTAQ